MLPSPIRLLRRSLLLVAAVLLCVGCGSSSPYALDEGRIAERFLPTERILEQHPDSLVDLRMVEKENKIEFELDKDYEALVTKWSCTLQNAGTSRSRRTYTYATLISKEVSLASLQAQTGVSTLTKDKSQEFITERLAEYENTIQIEVVWFGRPSNTAVAGPGTFVRLKDAEGNTYRPAARDYTPVGEAFVGASQTALFRRNIFVFPRTVDGRDILQSTSRLRLELRPSGGQQVWFVWGWEPPARAAR